jgi:hypothetical protein
MTATATQSYVDWLTLYLATKLTPAGVMTVTADPGIDNGRLYLVNDNQVEWINFTSVSASGSYFALGGLTRDVDPVTIPMTSLSTGKTWLATQKAIVVAAHDQLFNVLQGWPFASYTSAQLAARANKVVGETFFDTTLNTLVSWTWAVYASLVTAGAVVNATTTSTGGVELATPAEMTSGATTGSVWPLSAQPSVIQASIQSGEAVYVNSTTGSDTYTANLTPALTAYATGMMVRVKFDTVNTGACSLNLNSLGAKSIKLIGGSDPLDGDIATAGTYNLVYDGTNFVLQSVAVRATDAIASAGTSTITYVTPKQATLVTTGFTNISTTSGNSSVFTATKTGYVNMELEATHRDDQIGGVTSKIEFSTDWSNYSTVKSVVNNSTGGGGTTTTNRWYWVWFVNIGMKIRANVTVTSSGSGVAAFDYIN